ncbi:hypothetical protein IQ244_14770 [Nostoc sp. LEGE 06077]|nr:hypothetical protein [Nostoc sp. LEGE 06077]
MLLICHASGLGLGGSLALTQVKVRKKERMKAKGYRIKGEGLRVRR